MNRAEFVSGVAAAVVAQSGAPLPLHIASTAVDDVAPVLWALHTDAFTKAGLDVNLQRMNNGAAVTQAVIGGALDLGKSSLLPLINAHARGLPVTLVAPGGMWVSEAPISGILVAKDGPVRTAADLNGKTIATPGITDVSWVATRAWLDQHGGDSTTVKFVEVPQYALLGAVAEGRVAAATITVPAYTAALASGKVRLMGAADDAIAKRFMLTAWFTTTAYLASHGPAVARFADVLGRTAPYTNTHPSDTYAMVAEFAGLDPATLAHMTRQLCGDKLDPQLIQPLIDAAVKYGIIAKRFDAQELIAKAG